MRDDYRFAKIDVRMPRSPKIKVLSFEARWDLVEMLCWNREQDANGLLPARFAEKTWGQEVLDELCHNDDENSSLSLVNGHYVIHDVADYQPTKAEIEALREVRKAAGQRGGLARAKQLGTKRRPKRRQAAGKSQPEIEIEREIEREPSSGYLGGEGYASNARANGADAPPPPCPKHKHWDHAEPCRACEARRHWEQGAEERREAERIARDERRRVIDNCGICNNVGQVNLGGRDAPDWQTCKHPRGSNRMLNGLPYRDGEIDQIRLDALEHSEVPW